jgi:hypothetical protein
MFPAGDPQVHRAGWLNRIMTSHDQHQAQPIATRQTVTPLRPNAGLVHRVPTPVNKQQPGGNAFGAAAGSSINRPSTQAGARTQAAVDVPKQPNSARASAPGKLPALGGSLSSSKPQPPKLSPRDTATGIHAALSGTMQSTLSAARHSPTHPGLHNPLYTVDRDVYSDQEDAILAELNTLRRSPAAYAKIAAAHLRVREPFADPTMPSELAEASGGSGAVHAMNVDELERYASMCQTKLQEARDRLEQLEHGEERQIQTMREQWAAEDAERAKKKGKAPAAKKGDPKAASGAGAPQTQEEIDAEREAEIASFKEQNTAGRIKTKASIQELKQAADRAKQGVKVLRSLIAKLAATPPLPELERNRGLCLAARDLADVEVDGSVGVDPGVYTLRYGGGEGPMGQCVALGRRSPQQTVLDLLLCLQDPGKRRGRHALLGPTMKSVGVAWRRNVKHEASTAVVVAGHYSELSAIASRSHLPLQDVRRSLPFATKLSTNTAVRLDVPRNSGIEVLSPASHPVTTARKYTRVVVRCPVDSVVCAVICEQGQPEPKTPSFVAGNTFAQRTSDGGAVEIFAAFPGDGKYSLVLFGQLGKSAEEGHFFAGTQTMMFGASSFSAGTPRGGPLGGPSASVIGSSSSPSPSCLDDPTAFVFRRLGAVAIVVADSSPTVPPPTFPVPTTDFNDRRCRVETPLFGGLMPDCAYTFRLNVPLTAYKAAEIHRVEASLAAATRQVESSKAVSDGLEAELAQATAEINKAEEEHAAGASAAQAEIAAIQKDIAKKKGKELDKAKAALAEAEDRLATLDRSVREAKARKTSVEERIAAHRRASRQASAMRKRYMSDRAKLETITNRSKSLDVEISVEDRRARMNAVNEDATLYEVTVRTPRQGGLTLFISGIAVLEYQVDPETVDWPAEAFEFEEWAGQQQQRSPLSHQ